MFKRLVSIAVLCVMLVTLTVHAMEPRADGGNVSLTFNGTTAICTATCTGRRADDEVDVTLTLYQGSTVVDSWSKSGTYRVQMNEDCNVSRGRAYTLELVWTLNGQGQTSETVTKTCPLFG